MRTFAGTQALFTVKFVGVHRRILRRHDAAVLHGDDAVGGQRDLLIVVMTIMVGLNSRLNAQKRMISQLLRVSRLPVGSSASTHRRRS